MLSWRWTNGAALSLSDLSDPTVDASYALCVYAGSPSALIADMSLPAGAKWSAVGGSGYRFMDTVPPTGLRLRSGSGGKSAAAMAGRGVLLQRAFPFAAPVTVQLRKAGSPLCLESQFVVPQHSDAKRFSAYAP